MFCLPLLFLLHKLRAQCNIEEIDFCRVQVSSHLEKMGHSIGKPRMRSWRAFADAVAAGTRLIDEMLAKTSMGSCADFKVSGGDAACARWIDVLGQETVQVIARVGFKMFLNINANVTAMNAEGTECK